MIGNNTPKCLSGNFTFGPLRLPLSPPWLCTWSHCQSSAVDASYKNDLHNFWDYFIETKSYSPSWLGTNSLEHLASLHEVLDVLAQHCVFWLQLEVFLLDLVDPVSQVIQCVLKLENLKEQFTPFNTNCASELYLWNKPRLLFLFIWGEVWVKTHPDRTESGW